MSETILCCLFMYTLGSMISLLIATLLFEQVFEIEVEDSIGVFIIVVLLSYVSVIYMLYVVMRDIMNGDY